MEHHRAARVGVQVSRIAKYPSVVSQPGKGRPWYCARIQLRCELRVAAHVARWTHRCLRQTVWKRVGYAPARKSISTSYSPGHVFVRLDLARGGRRGIDEIIRIVHAFSNSGRPLATEKDVAGPFRTALVSGAIPLPATGLYPGRHFRALDGTFAKHISTLELPSSASLVKVPPKFGGMSALAPPSHQRSALAPRNQESQLFHRALMRHRTASLEIK